MSSVLVPPPVRTPESVREEGAYPRAILAGSGGGFRQGELGDEEDSGAGYGRAGYGPDEYGSREHCDAEYAPVGVTPAGLAPGDFGATVARVVDEELAGLTAAEEGRLAVIAPATRLAELAAAIPSAVTGDRADALESPIALLTVAQAKGLEFDRVVLADPAGIIAQSPKGGHDLYVAITRATHRLAVVHEGELPPLLSALTPSTPASVP